jgi:hypothetical protein
MIDLEGGRDGGRKEGREHVLPGLCMSVCILGSMHACAYLYLYIIASSM